MTIGPTLRRIRESAGLTQAQVGERMPTQITKQRVGAIEAADDLQHSTVVAYLAAVGHEIKIIQSKKKHNMNRSMSYSILLNSGTPDEYIEENDLTLEDALSQIEEMKAHDPEINAIPYARLASASENRR